jgi:polyisoprenoid-binding protein YceI
LKYFAVALTTLLLATPAAAERWFADPQKSQLGFSGEMQSGPVTGSFSKYWVDMEFDEADLSDAYIKVNIQTASINTNNEKRDTTLSQQEWLYTTMFPQATFKSDTISSSDGKTFVAKGKLDLRGAIGDVTLTFTFVEDPVYDAAKLIGGAKIQRLDFGLGQGQWLDESIVGNTIKIEVDLYMRPTLE